MILYIHDTPRYIFTRMRTMYRYNTLKENVTRGMKVCV